MSLAYPARIDTLEVQVRGPVVSHTASNAYRYAAETGQWVAPSLSRQTYTVTLPRTGAARPVIVAPDGVRISLSYPQMTPARAASTTPCSAYIAFGADLCATRSLSDLEGLALQHAVATGFYPESVHIARLDLAYDMPVSVRCVAAGSFAGRGAGRLQSYGSFDGEVGVPTGWSTTGGKRGKRRFDLAFYDAARLAAGLLERAGVSTQEGRLARLQARGYEGGPLFRFEFRTYRAGLKAHGISTFGDITPATLGQLGSYLMSSYVRHVEPHTAGRNADRQVLTSLWEMLQSSASCLDPGMWASVPHGYAVEESYHDDGSAELLCLCTTTGEVLASVQGTPAEGTCYRARREARAFALRV